jgi:hypothetical protein
MPAHFFAPLPAIHRKPSGKISDGNPQRDNRPGNPIKNMDAEYPDMRGSLSRFLNCGSRSPKLPFHKPLPLFLSKLRHSGAKPDFRQSNASPVKNRIF